MLRLEVLIKILFIVSMILVIEVTGSVVVSLVPLLIGWCKHAVVSVFLNYHFDGGLGVGWIGRAHSSLLLENARQTLAPEWRFAVE